MFRIGGEARSDAEVKGLKPGDEVGPRRFHTRSRKLMEVEVSLLHTAPQPGMRLVLRSPDGKERQVDVMAKVKVGKRVMDLTGSTMRGNDIWNLIREGENEDRLIATSLLRIGRRLDDLEDASIRPRCRRLE